MRGKIARRLRKIVEKETGINPVGSTPKYIHEVSARKRNLKGQVIERLVGTHHPTSPKAKYKRLKKQWRERWQ